MLYDHFKSRHSKPFKLFIQTFNVFDILRPKMFLLANYNSHLMIRNIKFRFNLSFSFLKQQLWTTKTKIRLCLIIRHCCHTLLLQTFTVSSRPFLTFTFLNKYVSDIKSFSLSDFIWIFRTSTWKWMSSRSALMADDIAWLRVRSS